MNIKYEIEDAGGCFVVRVINEHGAVFFVQSVRLFSTAISMLQCVHRDITEDAGKDGHSCK